MPTETMGQRIKRLREAAGLTQEKAAHLAGVPIGTLRGWEYDRRMPLLDAAGRLAEALGVSLDALVGKTPPADQAGVGEALAGQKKGKGKGKK